MKYVLVSLAAASALAATPAMADVTYVPASSGQGTLVHGTNVEQNAAEIIAALGAKGPEIVHFTGDTVETGGTSDTLHLQKGTGQADITGAELGGNKFYGMLSGDIFLDNHDGMDYLEFALTSGTGGKVDFTVTDALGGMWSFLGKDLGSGNTHFAFDTTGLSEITNLHWASQGDTKINILKQVRIDLANGTGGAVPEPSTWAMMILGIGLAGAVLRRTRRTTTLRHA